MYHFHCECRACAEDWCVFEDMSDILHLVPNFDSERAFKVRTGDKKDLVVEINRRRKDLQGRRTMQGPCVKESWCIEEGFDFGQVQL